jgi:hypothetical protein
VFGDGARPGQGQCLGREPATAEIGLLADLFTRDQDVSAAKTRQRLAWNPAHTSIVAELSRQSTRQTASRGRVS